MPYYDLKLVREAAQAGKVEYRGRRPSINVSNYGYDLSDVIYCLEHLSELDFDKTHYYKSGDIDDAYRFSYKRLTDDHFIVDKLYIKFCLLNDYMEIEIGSFKLN